jgi:aminoglycoside phosphotransferase (APT) family kinase protein
MATTLCSHAVAKVGTEALERTLARRFGTVGVVELRRVTGGASRETWLFDAVESDGTRHALVLRRDPAPGAVATDRATEFQLLDAAFHAGVPVPRVIMMLEAGDDLGAGFVMERIDGETIPRKILRDEEFSLARTRLAAQCGSIAAAIHATPVATLPPLSVQDADTQLEQWTAILDSFREPHPAFELGLRWLRGRTPDPGREPRLVHGDFRNGNFIVGHDGIRSVLDWELAHLGDPVEDLGWLCARAWRFGVDRVVGGFGDVGDLLDAYEAARGARPSYDTLRWWTALATLKWGVICLIQSFTHLNGVVRSVELAAIGRRVAENEYDLLRIVDGGW